MGLLFYSFDLLPCVRVRCRLYPHDFTILLFWFAQVRESVVDCIHMGLLFYSFWFAPMCESPLRTVSTWAFCFTLLICSHV